MAQKKEISTKAEEHPSNIEIINKLSVIYSWAGKAAEMMPVEYRACLKSAEKWTLEAMMALGRNEQELEKASRISEARKNTNKRYYEKNREELLRKQREKWAAKKAMMKEEAEKNHADGSKRQVPVRDTGRKSVRTKENAGAMVHRAEPVGRDAVQKSADRQTDGKGVSRGACDDAGRADNGRSGAGNMKERVHLDAGRWGVPQLCWDCARATNGTCSWSSEHKPVKGWKAERVYREQFNSYAVEKCPLFSRNSAENGQIRMTAEDLRDWQKELEAGRSEDECTYWMETRMRHKQALEQKKRQIQREQMIQKLKERARQCQQ